jgi:hypothetical protein
MRRGVHIEIERGRWGEESGSSSLWVSLKHATRISGAIRRSAREHGPIIGRWPSPWRAVCDPFDVRVDARRLLHLVPKAICRRRATSPTQTSKSIDSADPRRARPLIDTLPPFIE